MNRPVPRAISRAAFIAAAILIAYLIFSVLSLFIGRGNWILVMATVAIILAFAIPFVDYMLLLRLRPIDRSNYPRLRHPIR